MDYKALNLGREALVEMYRMMILIRHFEETTVAYFKQGHVIGNMHMYVGEEAVATVMRRLWVSITKKFTVKCWVTRLSRLPN